MRSFVKIHPGNSIFEVPSPDFSLAGFARKSVLNQRRKDWMDKGGRISIMTIRVFSLLVFGYLIPRWRIFVRCAERIPTKCGRIYGDCGNSFQNRRWLSCVFPRCRMPCLVMASIIRQYTTNIQWIRKLFGIRGLYLFLICLFCDGGFCVSLGLAIGKQVGEDGLAGSLYVDIRRQSGHCKEVKKREGRWRRNGSRIYG